MNGLDGIRGWKTIKQRLSFKGLGCCGVNWSPSRSTATMPVMEEEEEEPIMIMQSQAEALVESNVAAAAPDSASGMNLAMALSSERNLRRADVGPTTTTVKTLKRLIEETEGVDWRRKNNQKKDNNMDGVGCGGNESEWVVCCVCMERNKGAAFIPCGHTFCRVCSRELWVNRGSCPLCNRSILQILDIF